MAKILKPHYCTRDCREYCMAQDLHRRCPTCPTVQASPPLVPVMIMADAPVTTCKHGRDFGEICGDCFIERNASKVPEPDPRTKDTNPKDAIGDKKVPLWLCSPIAKAHWAVAQFVGMVKYGAWNWRSAGIRSSIYLSAIQRHLDAYTSGEEVDPVDLTPHLGHIMACCAIIIDAKAAGKLNDDRPPSVDLRAAYADCEAQMALARENYAHMLPRHFTIADTVSTGS